MSGLIACVFDGAAFVPTTDFHLRRAREDFGDGEVLMLTVEHERSMRSHRHYFASIHDLWLNLPERFAMETWAQSSEHLRRYALISTGFCDTVSYPCASAAEAQRWAAAIRPLDEFSVVAFSGPVVVRKIAKSQSVKAMGAEEFARSKSAVLEFIEGQLLGVAA